MVIYLFIFLMNKYVVCVFLQDEDELVLPLRPKKSPLNGLCCLTFGLVVFMAGLVLASIYVYRYYFIPHVRRHLLAFRLQFFLRSVISGTAFVS